MDQKIQELLVHVRRFSETMKVSRKRHYKTTRFFLTERGWTIVKKNNGKDEVEMFL